MKLCVKAPLLHQNPFWLKQIWLRGWTVNTQVLLCWDKAMLCMYVQSWAHTWCGRGAAVAGLLPQSCICRVLCTLKSCTHKNQSELSLGSASACLEGLWSLKLLLDVWIAVSVWCCRCQLCQKCVQRTPPHGPNSILVAPWATICSSNLQLAIFFPLVWAKDLVANEFLQHHPCTWWLGPTLKGLERNTTAAARGGFEAQGNCCPGCIEVLKTNFFSGANYFQIILILYCFVSSLHTLILNRIG